MKSKAGPKPSRNAVHGLLSCSGLALISTWWSIKNASKPGPTNVGSVVSNVTAVVGAGREAARPSLLAGDAPFGAALLSLVGGYVTGVLNRPVMISPAL